MLYKTIAINEDGEQKIIEMEYRTKAEFIHDLRANGYKVNASRVKTSDEWNRIMNTTNCEKWDWNPGRYK